MNARWIRSGRTGVAKTAGASTARACFPSKASTGNGIEAHDNCGEISRNQRAPPECIKPLNTYELQAHAVAPRRLSIQQGTGVSIVGLAVAVLLLLPVSAPLPPLLAFVLLLASAILFLVAPHCLAHFLVGRALGVRFLYYFITRSALQRAMPPALQAVARRIPLLAIRIAPHSLKAVSNMRTAAMFAAGTIVSMTLPWVPVGYGLVQGQAPAAMVVALVAAANVGFTLYFSPRVGDLSRARRALVRGSASPLSIPSNP